MYINKTSIKNKLKKSCIKTQNQRNATEAVRSCVGWQGYWGQGGAGDRCPSPQAAAHPATRALCRSPAASGIPVACMQCTAGYSIPHLSLLHPGDKIWISARPPQHLFPQIYSPPPPPPTPQPPFFLFLLLVQYEVIIAGLKVFFQFFFSFKKNKTSLSLAGNLGHHTWVMHSSCKSSATHSYQGMQYFGVSQQTYGCQCLGYLTCTKMLMLVIACHMTGFLTDIELWQPKGRKWFCLRQWIKSASYAYALAVYFLDFKNSIYLEGTNLHKTSLVREGC